MGSPCYNPLRCSGLPHLRMLVWYVNSGHTSELAEPLSSSSCQIALPRCAIPAQSCTFHEHFEHTLCQPASLFAARGIACAGPKHSEASPCCTEGILKWADECSWLGFWSSQGLTSSDRLAAALCCWVPSRPVVLSLPFTPPVSPGVVS